MSIHTLQYSLIHSLDSESQGFMPTMLAVHTLRPDDYLSAAAPADESLVCISALTGDRFQIRLMPRSASGGQNWGCGGFFVSGNDTRLLIGQTASITLILDPENGLRFPAFVALSSDELTVHVSTAGDGIYIRSAVWRLFHKTFEPLPCYSYQVGVVTDADSHIIPLPMQLAYTLRRVSKLTFSVYAI